MPTHYPIGFDASGDKPVRERVPEYVQVGFPVGMDSYPYTQEERERLCQMTPTWCAVVAAG